MTIPTAAGSWRPAPRSITRVRAQRVHGMDLFLGSVIALVLIAVWRLHIIWPRPLTELIVPLRLALIAAVLAAVGWSIASDPARRLRELTALKSGKLMLALLGVAVASIPLGGFPTRAFNFFIDSYITVFALFLLIAACVRSFRDLERIGLAFVIGGLVYCARVITKLRVDDQSGRLDNAWSYDANDIAFVIVCTLPLVVYFLRAGQPLFRRAVAIITLPVLMVALVRTGSRGGFLGFVVVAGFLLLRFRTISWRLRLAAVGAALTVLIVVGNDVYWSLMKTILHPTEDYNYAGQSDRGRIETWKRGVGYMVKWPVAGVGLNNFAYAEGQSEVNAERVAAGQGWVWAAPHNSFVQVGVELGVTGLILFVWLLGTLVRSLNTLARAGPGSPEGAFAQALVGSFVGYVVSGFFLTQGYSAILYGLLGLSLGLLKLRSLAPVPSEALVHRPHRRVVLTRRIAPVG